MAATTRTRILGAGRFRCLFDGRDSAAWRTKTPGRGRALVGSVFADGSDQRSIWRICRRISAIARSI